MLLLNYEGVTLQYIPIHQSVGCPDYIEQAKSIRFDFGYVSQTVLLPTKLRSLDLRVLNMFNSRDYVSTPNWFTDS